MHKGLSFMPVILKNDDLFKKNSLFLSISLGFHKSEPMRKQQ